MPFASINPTNPRTNPWNFHEKILRIGDFEKWALFESAILIFFSIFFHFFCFISMKTSQSLLVSKDGSKFWWLPWFPVVFYPGQTFLSRVYMISNNAVVQNKVTNLQSTCVFCILVALSNFLFCFST